MASLPGPGRKGSLFAAPALLQAPCSVRALTLNFPAISLNVSCFLAQIGLMRNGTLLAEDRPDRLLARYACSTMEEVFLKLSLRQQRALAVTTDSAPVTARAVDSAEMAVEAAVEEPITEHDLKEEPPVLEDPAKLHCKPVYLREHSNTLPCLWKNLTYMKRNLV